MTLWLFLRVIFTHQTFKPALFLGFGFSAFIWPLKGQLKIGEELIGHFFGKTVYQARTDLGEFAANAGFHFIA